MSTRTFFLIDDDPAIRRAMQAVAEMMQVQATSFASAEEFLASDAPQHEGCLVIDIRLPGMSGLELQRHLRELSCDMPIIIISGHADVPMAVEAMQRGALTVLTKPFRLQDVVNELEKAFADSDVRLAAKRLRMEAQERLSKLTEREREVLDLICQGLTNKQMAARLSLTIRAIEDRRSRLMRRLAVRSVPELLTLLQQAQAQA